MSSEYEHWYISTTGIFVGPYDSYEKASCRDNQFRLCVMDNHESRIKGTVAGIALLLVLLLPAACSPRIIREVVTETHTVVRDSTVWRDTTIRVPIPLEKDQAIVTIGDTSELETSIARSTAYIDSTGRLKHTLENKRGQIETTVKIPARMIWTNVTSNKAEILKQKVMVEKPLSWWQNFRIGAFWWLLAGLATCLVYIFRKPILKLLKAWLHL